MHLLKAKGHLFSRNLHEMLINVTQITLFRKSVDRLVADLRSESVRSPGSGGFGAGPRGERLPLFLFTHPQVAKDVISVTRYSKQGRDGAHTGGMLTRTVPPLA